MYEIQKVIISGAISILTILLGMVFTQIRQYLLTKSAQLKASKTADEWTTIQAIASTVVQAVEQIYTDLKGKRKLEQAKIELYNQLKVRGIEIDESQLRPLIESAVHEMNLTKDIILDKATEPIKRSITEPYGEGKIMLTDEERDHA
ncbi:MAG: phage holin [Facklamia hominis]